MEVPDHLAKYHFSPHGGSRSTRGAPIVDLAEDGNYTGEHDCAVCRTILSCGNQIEGDYLQLGCALGRSLRISQSSFFV
jgi:hypothetical protein